MLLPRCPTPVPRPPLLALCPAAAPTGKLTLPERCTDRLSASQTFFPWEAPPHQLFTLINPRLGSQPYDPLCLLPIRSNPALLRVPASQGVRWTSLVVLTATCPWTSHMLSLSLSFLQSPVETGACLMEMV